MTCQFPLFAQQPLFVFFCTALLVIASVYSYQHTAIDAFPDVTNTQFTLITQWPGRLTECTMVHFSRYLRFLMRI